MATKNSSWTHKVRTITVTEALTVPSTELPGLQFADDDASWRSDAWAVLREMRQTGETAMQACGSELLFSARGVGSTLRVVPDRTVSP